MTAPHDSSHKTLLALAYGLLAAACFGLPVETLEAVTAMVIAISGVICVRRPRSDQ